jgi:hypothetical protein
VSSLVFQCGTEAQVVGLLALPSYSQRPDEPPSDAVNGRAVRCRWVDAHRVFPGFYGYWIEPRCIMEDRGKGLFLLTFFCAAQLLSNRAIRGAAADGSGVVMAWFQDTLEPLLSDFIRQEARDVRWDQIASNFEIEYPESDVEESEQPRIARRCN